MSNNKYEERTKHRVQVNLHAMCGHVQAGYMIRFVSLRFMPKPTTSPGSMYHAQFLDHSNLMRNGNFIAVLKSTCHPTGAPSLSFPQHTDPGGFTNPMSKLPVTPHPLAKLHPARHRQQQYGYWSIPDPQEGLNPASDSALAPDHPDDSMVLSDFIVQQRPRELRDTHRLQLSRPLLPSEMPLVGPAPPPRSIGYGVFCASHPSEPHDFTS
ncbi:hypothetical protein EIP86_010287 [Pleurotus ostreatoroseus]|nr:hypothetical protein EIP86_010287 [Pleurotus ostreatoroseus]